MDAAKRAVVPTDEPDSKSGVTHRASDPVLAALEAAPWAPLSDEENTLLDDIERSAIRFIPHDAFIAALGSAHDR